MEAARPTRDEMEEELVSKKGATSVVWNFFGIRKSDNEQKWKNSAKSVTRLLLLEVETPVTSSTT